MTLSTMLPTSIHERPKSPIENVVSVAPGSC